MPSEPNPFSTRFVQPGAIPYLFEAGSLAEVIGSFESQGRWGQIVGPHGSGKTTLLRAILGTRRRSR